MFGGKVDSSARRDLKSVKMTPSVIMLATACSQLKLSDVTNTVSSACMLTYLHGLSCLLPNTEMHPLSFSWPAGIIRPTTQLQSPAAGSRFSLLML